MLRAKLQAAVEPSLLLTRLAESSKMGAVRKGKTLETSQSSCPVSEDQPPGLVMSIIGETLGGRSRRMARRVRTTALPFGAISASITNFIILLPQLSALCI